MKKGTGDKNILLRLSNTGFILITAVVPLVITKITYSQSDLPKCTSLIISGSIIIITSFLYLIFTIFKSSKNNNPYEFKFSPLIDVPLLIYFAAILISFLLSINQYVSFNGEYERQIGVLTYIYLILIYFSAGIFKRGLDFLRKLVLTMEVTAVIIAIYAIMQQAGSDPFGIQPADIHRPVSTIGNAVFLGGLLALILPLSVFNISEKKNKILTYILPAIIFTGIIVTRTRSAYLAVAAEVFCFVINSILTGSKKSLKYAFAGLGILLIALIIISVALPGNIFTARLLSIFSSQDNQRWLIWADALKVFYKYPVTGTGIGNFPTAFAEFYSYRLRYDDVMRFVDNAHNNYLQVLCTTGILGLTGFVSVITGTLLICFKQIKSFKNADSGKNKIFSASICALAGYCVYGLTNFDDIPILVYFILILVLVRASAQGKIIKVNLNPKLKPVVYILFIMVSLFMAYNSYSVILKFSADINFLKGQQSIGEKNYKDGIELLNRAIIAWPQNPVYRYTIANEIYSIIKSSKNDDKIRNSLLEQAEKELIKAAVNHSNKNACDALRCLIIFESGKLTDAEALKEKVLKADAVNVFFRMNLVYYYTNSSNKNFAKEQIDELNKIGFKSKELYFVEALYYLTVADKQEAIKKCDQLLEIDPANRDALEIKRRAMLLN